VLNHWRAFSKERALSEEKAPSENKTLSDKRPREKEAQKEPLKNPKAYIVMDAPPKREPIEPFIAIGTALGQQAVHTPHIYAQNIEQGFLLLEDLGNRTYLDELSQAPDHLYGDAIKALIKLQLGGQQQSDFKPPMYDANKLEQEMDLFRDWYLDKHLDIQLDKQQSDIWEHLKNFLIDACMEQPKTWVHRDYHSRNLMVTEHNSPGVIDFQDMVLGPIAYDLASIFKDCYIEWPRNKQRYWLEQYHQQALSELNIEPFKLDDLIRWVDLTGLQRHLKVLGIFCRLNYRDNKPHYLADLPLVKKYVLEVLELYPSLNEFRIAFTHALQHSPRA